MRKDVPFYPNKLLSLFILIFIVLMVLYGVLAVSLFHGLYGSYIEGFWQNPVCIIKFSFEVLLILGIFSIEYLLVMCFSKKMDEERKAAK